MSNFRLFSPLWLLLWLLLPPFHSVVRRRRQPSLRFPNLWAVCANTPQNHPSHRATLSLFRSLGLAFLIFALAKPQHVEKTHETHKDAIDIVVALDLSSSMMALDFWEQSKPLVTRLDVAKKLTTEFIEKRPHDRIGLIGFAGESYVVSPAVKSPWWCSG
jgi:Ca-activated chloride channel family protein